MECRVLFRDQQCIEDEHLEHGHPLTEDERYKCIVSHTQCRHAKSFALDEGDAALQDHYGYLRSYAMALANSNKGTTVKLGVTVNPYEKTYFEIFYVCFQVPNGNGLTLISDQHKGLIEAVKEIMPLAEHRQCARHIYEGFKKHGQELTLMKACAVKQLRMGLVNVSTQFWLNRMVESHLSNVLCPKPKRMSGRPKKKRIRASHEPKFSTTKISRAGAIITCHNCWEKGHNKSTCKKDPISVVPKEKGKSSRPKKQQNMETVPEDNEILTFVHNPRDEMGASNSRGVFDDRR
ncbi:pentatricopeptide repeat-containing protein, partial [Tanacetum coccineum]